MSCHKSSINDRLEHKQLNYSQQCRSAYDTDQSYKFPLVFYGALLSDIILLDHEDNVWCSVGIVPRIWGVFVRYRGISQLSACRYMWSFNSIHANTCFNVIKKIIFSCCVELMIVWGTIKRYGVATVSFRKLTANSTTWSRTSLALPMPWTLKISFTIGAEVCYI